MAQQINVKIELFNGEKISPFNSLVIEQYINGHHRFEVRFPVEVLEEKDASMINKSKAYIGKSIVFSLSTKTSSGYPENIFKGIICEINIVKSEKGLGDLVFRGYSPTILLEAERHCVSFSEKGLPQIVKAVTSHIPQNLLKININPAYKSTIPYMVQYKENANEFLLRMAAEHAEAFYFDGTELYFGKPTSPKTIDLVFQQDISDLNFSFKLLPLKFSNYGYDYQSFQLFSNSSSSSNVPGLDAFGKLALQESDKIFGQEGLSVIERPIKTKNDLDQFIKNRKSSRASELVYLNGACDSPYVKIGTNLNIKVIKGSAKEDFGKFLTTSVTHSTDGIGNYTNTFEAIPASLEVMPPPLAKRPSCEPQSAIVKKNEDPEGMGRVRVQFHWQKPPELSPWLRLVTSHSGDKKGFYFVPELEEEVLIGFEQFDANQPYVMGSLYHGKNKPEWNNKGNNLKAIKTKSGNLIQFNDENGKEEIRIQNKDATNEITLTLKDDGKITIKAKSKIELSSKKITMRAKEIDIKAEKTYKVQTDKGEILATSDLDLKGMKTSLEATQELSMQGMQVKMNGTTTAITSVAKLDVIGGGIATIKAGVIKLN